MFSFTVTSVSTEKAETMTLCLNPDPDHYCSYTHLNSNTPLAHIYLLAKVC